MPPALTAELRGIGFNVMLRNIVGEHGGVASGFGPTPERFQDFIGAVGTSIVKVSPAATDNASARVAAHMRLVVAGYERSEAVADKLYDLFAGHVSLVC